MRREGERVVIDISEEEYTGLLRMMGFCAGTKFAQGDLPGFRAQLLLANAINAGNPDWTCYEVPDV